jgi:hypothetical protein
MIDTVVLMTDRFRISRDTAKVIHALIESRIMPTTFSFVRDRCAEDASHAEKVLMAVSYLLGVEDVRQLVYEGQVIGLYVGRDGESGWSLISLSEKNEWQIARPCNVIDQIARHS